MVMTCFARSTKIFNITFIFFVVFFKVCFCTQNVRLILPPFVHADTTATLHCLYDLKGASLYSVQWYRGKFEFFRFVPNENPQRKAFSFPGLSVDVPSSNAHEVTLRNIPIQISGEFSCEVTAEAPRFRTSRASSILTVVGSDLEVKLIKKNFYYGDIVEANCTLTPYLPMTKLKFYWNVTPVSDQFITTHHPLSIFLKLDSSILLPEEKIPISVLLTCSAVLNNTYYIISKSVSFRLEPFSRSGRISKAHRSKNKTINVAVLHGFIFLNVIQNLT